MYKVDGDDLKKKKDFEVSGQNLDFQKDISKHEQIWGLVKKVVPNTYRGKMTELLIYSGQADGTAGFVVQTSNDLSTWKMGIAIDYAYQDGFNTNNELSYTIIHEFGHILSLNNSQLDAGTSKENCANYFSGEGCAMENSYINQLHKRFWADIYKEGDYAKHPDRFVTEYAAINPGEDIAELFTVFVTRADKPSGTRVKDKKVQMLYEYPDLVHLRTNLGDDGTKSQNLLPITGQWKQKYKCKHAHD